MNLVMASVLLLAMLAFQPTLIYGSKGLVSGSFRSIAGNGKKHSALSKAASLVMEMESGDVFVRRARGASGMDAPAAAAAASTTSTVGGSNGKRGKNNNKKSNKNAASEQTPASSSSAAAALGSSGRKHSDKKFSAAGNQQQHGNNNNKGKQRQLLKSQQHQNHGKRNGGGSGSKAAAAGVKASNDEKSQSTCRYAKSAWSECDAATNSKTRTLTLKKGESNCLATRTIQKKCKKACRYEKGAWSECTDGQMTRQDKLKATGSVDSSSCEAERSINKKCNPGGAVGSKGGKSANKERKNKDKASRRAQQQQA